MKTLLVSLCLALAHSVSYAEFKDGNKLLGELKDTSSFYNQGVAMGYITGVADSLVGVMFCPPPNVTAGQLNDMVKNYLENVPAERHMSADLVVTKVMKTMWPCKKSGGSL